MSEHTSSHRIFIEINTEKLAKEIKWQEKHADKLWIINDVVIIIEETRGRAKPDDIDKLDKTIRALLKGSLRSHIPLPENISKIVAIVHSEGKVDSMVPKLIANKNSEWKRTLTNTGIALLIVHCNKELISKLQKYGIRLK